MLTRVVSGLSTAGMVFSAIFTSSHSDQLSMSCLKRRQPVEREAATCGAGRAAAPHAGCVLARAPASPRP